MQPPTEIRRLYQAQAKGTLSSWYEEMVADLLASYGIDHFERQFQIGKFRVDFFFPLARAVVEIDGPYHDFPRGRERDKLLRVLLEQMGFVLLSVPINALDSDPHHEVMSLAKALIKRAVKIQDS